MPRYGLSFGTEKLGFELPRGWKVLSCAEPREIDREASPGEPFRRSLADSIDSEPLELGNLTGNEF